MPESDAICYTDYSKELECGSQEQIKSGMYGASNVTKQLIGQIFEIKVKPPSEPTLVSFDIVSQKILFEKPLLDGGSRIQNYEIHIKSDSGDTWYFLKLISVK